MDVLYCDVTLGLQSKRQRWEPLQAVFRDHNLCIRVTPNFSGSGYVQTSRKSVQSCKPCKAGVRIRKAERSHPSTASDAPATRPTARPSSPFSKRAGSNAGQAQGEEASLQVVHRRDSAGPLPVCIAQGRAQHGESGSPCSRRRLQPRLSGCGGPLRAAGWLKRAEPLGFVG